MERAGSSGSAAGVCCVLVNWNSYADTLACLESLGAQEYAALRVIVVDNGSTNDSVERIRAAFPEVELIAAGRNLGFSAGTNVGLRRGLESAAEFFWVLNNDTVAPPDTCSKLVKKALAEPRAGMVGSVLYYMHDPAKVQAWGGGNLTVWLGRSTHFTGPAALGAKSYLTFASVLIRREVLMRVGLLYEGFFMYFDDSDYGLRVTRAGYGMAVAGDTAILHKEGGSMADKRSPVVDRYYFAAGMHFLRRHAAWPALSMVLFVTTKVAKRVMAGEWRNVGAALAAIADYRRQRGAGG